MGHSSPLLAQPQTRETPRELSHPENPLSLPMVESPEESNVPA